MTCKERRCRKKRAFFELHSREGRKTSATKKLPVRKKSSTRKKSCTRSAGAPLPLGTLKSRHMRLLPATATVAPGLNSVAWASLISAVPRPRPRPQPLMNLFGDIFGGDDMLKAQVACWARARVSVSVRIRVSTPTCSTRRRTSVSARSFLSWSRIRQPLTCCKRSFSH